MRRTSVGLLSLALAAGMGVTIGAPMVGALPTASPKIVQAGDAAAPAHSDDLSSPQQTKARALKQRALTEVLEGKTTAVKKGKSTVAKVTGAKKPGGGTDEYVELSRQGTDKIFVVLAEFGNQRSASYPDIDSDPDTPGPTTWDGPLHNAIPQPNRTLDNSTNWNANYSKDYFQNLYFGDGGVEGSGGTQETVKQWYERQSSGRYSIDGQVSDWVKVPYNEARYGRDVCGSHVCTNTWALVRDAVNQWVARPEGQGPDGRADQGHPRDLRPVGPLRREQQRQLQRARRLHRPLPDRARGRRPGRRRPDPGRGRHLVAPLVRLLQHGR